MWYSRSDTSCWNFREVNCMQLGDWSLLRRIRCKLGQTLLTLYEENWFLHPIVLSGLCWVWHWLPNYGTVTSSVVEGLAQFAETLLHRCRLLHCHKRERIEAFLCIRKWNLSDSKIIPLRFIGLHYLGRIFFGGGGTCSSILLRFHARRKRHKYSDRNIKSVLWPRVDKSKVVLVLN